MPLLLAYYGDDFSGSTDALEALASAGVPTRLYLKPPSLDELARSPELRAVGLAGNSRSLPVDNMEGVLQSAFEHLRMLSPTLVHYKVCSTFDSSPVVGSIGRAIDIGHSIFGGPYVPLVVGSPALGRYCTFGNLFAHSGSDRTIYRLDRHPTMSRHPVTPMRESDLRRLLAEQTTKLTGLVDATQLECGTASAEESIAAAIADGSKIVVFDTITAKHLAKIGQILWDPVGGSRPNLVVGSSGVEQALVSRWRKLDVVSNEPPVVQAVEADRILVVSGSCSPVTARQIDDGQARGFAVVPLLSAHWVRGDAQPALQQVLGQLRAGQSVIVHAAVGPNDPRIAEARRQLATSGQSGVRDELLGQVLAAAVRAAIDQEGIRRVVVTGGDTSGAVARELGIAFLEFLAPITAGAPLCRVFASDPASHVNGIEMLFKGGQVGSDSFFEQVRLGRNDPGSVAERRA